MVGGQGQAVRRAAKVVDPVLLLTLQDRALQVLALPGGVIAITDAQGRQRVGLTGVKGGVQGTEFTDKQTDRPAIGNEVVQRQPQQVGLRIHTEQLPLHQRAGAQVKHRGEDRQAVAGCHGDYRQRERAQTGGFDDLNRVALYRLKAGAQGRMAGHDAVQRPGQRGDVQWPLQLHRALNHIGGAGSRVELGQKPEALLGQ